MLKPLCDLLTGNTVLCAASHTFITLTLIHWCSFQQTFVRLVEKKLSRCNKAFFAKALKCERCYATSPYTVWLHRITSRHIPSICKQQGTKRQKNIAFPWATMRLADKATTLQRNYTLFLRLCNYSIYSFNPHEVPTKNCLLLGIRPSNRLEFQKRVTVLTLRRFTHYPSREHYK